MPGTLRLLSNLVGRSGLGTSWKRPFAAPTPSYSSACCLAAGAKGSSPFNGSLTIPHRCSSDYESTVARVPAASPDSIANQFQPFNQPLLDRRREFVAGFSDTDLISTGQWWYTGKGDTSRQVGSEPGNCSTSSSVAPDCLPENVFGLSRVPVGMVGPLLIRGEYVNGYTLVPFGTTEGALIASATRGGLAMSRAGGVTCHIQSDTVRKAPVFVTSSLEDSMAVGEWIADNRQQIAAGIAKKFSLVLSDMETTVSGRYLYCSMDFNCAQRHIQRSPSNTLEADIKAAVRSVVECVETALPEVDIRRHFLEGFQTGNQRAAMSNVASPNGISVHAECFLPESVLKDVLKISKEHLLTGYGMMREGQLTGGSPMVQINVTNTIIAMYLATGQDAGITSGSAVDHMIVESVSAEEVREYQQQLQTAPPFMEEYHRRNIDFKVQGNMLDANEKREGGVYISMTMPSLQLKTAGGACDLPTQKECLSIMRCNHSNPDARYRLAEIVAASSLALDLSCLAAVSSGQFASAHEKLGRNRPGLGLRREHLTEEFFSEVVADLGELVECKQTTVDARTSILSDMTKTQLSKFVGHFAFDMTVRNKAGKLDTIAMVMKSKSTDRETCNVLNRLAQGCGLDLATHYEVFKLDLGFRKCHVRELEMIRHTDPRFTSISPRTYYIKQDTAKEVLVYFMEHLKDMIHFTTADNPVDWSDDERKLVLADVARFHSLYYGKEKELLAKDWLDVRCPDDMLQKTNLWLALLANNSREHPEIWTGEVCALAKLIIGKIGDIWQHFEKNTRTLVHNDFNPRNLCIRPADQTSDGKQHLCLYDWELATLHVPQRDVAEFLSFMLPIGSSVGTWHTYIDHHRRALEEATGCHISAEQYLDTFDIVLCDLLVNRIALYGMAHTFKDYRFYSRLVGAPSNYLTKRMESSQQLAAFLHQ